MYNTKTNDTFINGISTRTVKRRIRQRIALGTANPEQAKPTSLSIVSVSKQPVFSHSGHLTQQNRFRKKNKDSSNSLIDIDDENLKAKIRTMPATSKNKYEIAAQRYVHEITSD